MSKESFRNTPETGERETPLVPSDRTFPTEPNTARPISTMKQIDYCRHSGLSKARISELVRQGMPLDSQESADTWRRLNTWSRKPPAPPPAAPTADPAPTTPPSPPEAQERPTPADPSALESTRVGEAYRRLERAERACWGLLCAALKNQTLDAARLLDLHSRSVRHLADSRQDVLNLAEREKTLVSGDWVRRVMQEHDGVLAQLIRTMPRQLAGRISPLDPEHCERELQRWTDEVFLKTLHATDPWQP